MESSIDGGPSFSFFLISDSFFVKYWFNCLVKLRQSFRDAIFTKQYFFFIWNMWIEIKINVNLFYIFCQKQTQIRIRYFCIPSNELWLNGFLCFIFWRLHFKKALYFETMQWMIYLKFTCMFSETWECNFQRNSVKIIENLCKIFDLHVCLIESIVQILKRVRERERMNKVIKGLHLTGK